MAVKRNIEKPMVFDLDIIKPPESFTLLINPSNFELKFTPKITEQRIRTTAQNIGYIFQAHHDELDTMTASGMSAMFVSTNKGITRVDRTSTVAYENIQQLLAIYRNNGTNINRKTGSITKPCMIDTVGRVVITYDGFVYRGHFLTFSTSETDDKPFNISFSFDFKVTQTIDIGWFLQQKLRSTSTF